MLRSLLILAGVVIVVIAGAMIWQALTLSSALGTLAEDIAGGRVTVSERSAAEIHESAARYTSRSIGWLMVLAALEAASGALVVLLGVALRRRRLVV